MKKLLSYFNRVLCALVLCASLVSFGSPVSSYSEGVSNATNEPLVNSFSGVNLTLSLRKLTECGVEFYGKAVLSGNYSADEFGIVYSTDENFTESDASFISIDEIYGTSFSVPENSLEPGTTYYYASFIKKGSFYKYSSVKSFTTKSLSVPILYAASQITQVSALINGKVLPPLDQSSDWEFGLEYSQDESFSSGVTREEISVVDSNNKFSKSIASLTPGKTYFYRSYIKVSDVYSYCEVKSFTTANLDTPSLKYPTDVTAASATISGTVSLADSNVSDLEYGFQYSTSSDFSSDVNSHTITDIDSENGFSLPISSLNHETVYYYRSYVKVNGGYIYGDVKSFTTMRLPAPVLYAASQITEKTALISGEVVVPSNCKCVLEYSVHEDFSDDVVSIAITDIDSDNKFGMLISSFFPETTYYFRSYIEKDGVYTYSTVNSFTTLQHPYNSSFDLNISSASDLSSSASANCCIVSNAGLYKFKTVKGNSSESVGNVASASILWETFGTSQAPEYFDLIKAVCYKDGYIIFQTADTFKEGNAVIAAKDASGTILWSWHIWLTDQPQGQIYNKKAGTMMDRNLGATSATPGDVGALGLLYQWGRKDPFLGSSSISSSALAKSTITWPSSVDSDSSTGTIAYATAHPTTFITCNRSNYDWYYTGSQSTDNTRWATSKSNKSILDPCPAGWRVPDGGEKGVWSKALGSSDPTDDLYDITNGGMNFSGYFGSASTIWYPASGYRNSLDGSLSTVGNYGYYWSASPSNNYAYGLYFNYNGRVDPSGGDYCAFGHSVRCIKE